MDGARRAVEHRGDARERRGGHRPVVGLLPGLRGHARQQRLRLQVRERRVREDEADRRQVHRRRAADAPAAQPVDRTVGQPFAQARPRPRDPDAPRGVRGTATPVVHRPGRRRAPGEQRARVRHHLAQQHRPGRRGDVVGPEDARPRPDGARAGRGARGGRRGLEAAGAVGPPDEIVPDDATVRRRGGLRSGYDVAA